MMKHFLMVFLLLCVGCAASPEKPPQVYQPSIGTRPVDPPSDDFKEATLLAGLSDADWRVRVETIKTIGKKKRLSTPIVSALLKIVEDEEERAFIRVQAAGVLGSVTPGSQENQRALLALLKNADAQVRADVALLLARLAPGVQEAVPDLLVMLDDADAHVRYSAVSALTGVQASAEVLQALKLALFDSSVLVRMQAALAIKEMGPSAASLVPELKQTLNDPDLFVRRNAKEALEAIGTPEAMSALEGATE